MDYYNSERILDVDVTEEMETSFLEYAYSVIYSRALPDARDGLKPVQRRILFSMDQLGLHPDGSHVKCARVVGQVMGVLHPHGDTAIYDALVRMAQPWSMRLPLVDGHGNYGSLDAGAAAMRYTESRMKPAAAAMVKGLDQETVDLRHNYDGCESEPVVLPAAFPNLLINGATGIAVGMVTNIPPHNLVEVVAALKQLLVNPDIELDELMLFLPGPDLPGGGRIIGLDGVREAYATGRGNFRIRATSHIEKVNAGRQCIVVTELPYMIGPERIIEQIRRSVNEKKLIGIADVKDLTDLTNGTRLVIEVKIGINPEALLEQLYIQTNLEDTFAINAVALVEGQPRTLTLKQILKVYLDHRFGVLLRRSQCQLRRASEKLHLVSGLLIALADINEVTAIIRSSDDAAQARTRLIAAFNLDEPQTNHILDIKLGRLTKYSVTELEEAANTQTELLRGLTDLVRSPKTLRRLLAMELDDMSTELGTPRRTKLLTPKHNILNSFPLTPPTDAQYMEASVARMWNRIRSRHATATPLPLRGPLPRLKEQPGCLYTLLEGDEQICAVLGPSLSAAWAHLKAGMVGDPVRALGLWVPGSPSEILRHSPLLQFDAKSSALQRGRPMRIIDPTQLRDAPPVGGIYRIHRIGNDGTDEIYIGRTSNFRRRPYQHEKIAGRPWGRSPGNVRVIELLPAKNPNPAHVWAAVDLDLAEERHITRARERELQGGPRVLNVTVGRNGRPSEPGTRLFIWPPAKNQ